MNCSIWIRLPANRLPCPSLPLLTGFGVPNLTVYLSKSRAMLFLSHQAPKEPTMEWTAPKHEEIDLNCEISSYANAEL